MLDEWASIQSSSRSFIPDASASSNNNVPIDDGDEAFEDLAVGIVAKSSIGRMFTVDELERNASKGHGAITNVAAANNVILVGTNRGWLIRHDFSGGEVLELDLTTSRVVEQSVHKVFIDPGGKHALITIRSSAGAETYYIHSKWRKPRVLSKLKGLLVNAVAWNRQQINEASTREFLIGTSNGQLNEVLIEEKDKKEKYVKLLFELTELREPFVGLQMEVVGSGLTARYLVMAVTLTKLYIFSGTGSLEAVFLSYADRVARFTELPGEMPSSELLFYGKRHAESFAWLAGPGVYHGQLNLSTQQSEEHFLSNKRLLEYSKISEEGMSSRPCSFALSEFHFLLLYSDRLKVINRVSQKIVEEERFDARLDASTSVMLGLCTDYLAGAFYAYNETSIFEVAVQDEGRDMWQVYLDLKEYTAALEHCREPLQRDRVYEAQAEAAFNAGEYLRAASFFAKINIVTTFEEIALKFVTVGEQDALRTYLLRKLDNLGKDERSQITMIATWATELYLDKINRLLLDDSKGKGGDSSASETSNDEYLSTLKEFRAFLSDCKDVLDEATTLKLLGSYGRVEELVYYANIKEQHEMVIHHYIQQRDAKKALAVFRKRNVSPELQYKFAPALLMLDPYETVEFWMTCSDLNTRRLIPALMRYSNEPRAKDEPHEAIKYLEFCIQRQQNEDGAVHNLLLSLYVKQEDESALLRFLETKYGKGRPGKPDYFYDPKYALRLCLEEKRLQACVFIYSMMGMHEEAVALALWVDPELAKIEADKVEDDIDLRKKLWLMIAKHVIQQEKGIKGENIRKAIAFLKETDGLLKIEDILPFFPDFTLIDDFKDAICSSLEDYNRQIEELKLEMNDATRGADNIRRDISALSQRYAIIGRDEECGVCGRKILALGTVRGSHGSATGYASFMAPFYIFPCEHTFHADCLVGYVTKHVDQGERDLIMELKNKLKVLVNEMSKVTTKASNNHNEVPADGGSSPLEQIRAQLDDVVAGECPFCGELMIREIAQPFISSEEAELAASWEISSGSLSREYGLV
ncbi:hypothetical protein O6H91_07G034600 [Diphasiastrum complanatum]|uniref:Uncharacterized protein n=1 Tax=Diphasiastrum complanatum TaxID=34168 RepID=A0ACC2D3V3_DIPCM|nr:hypothetical protein O6H91_07G034600 [Diphasiastrum complanatum]